MINSGMEDLQRAAKKSSIKNVFSQFIQIASRFQSNEIAILPVKKAKFKHFLAHKAHSGNSATRL